MCRRGEWGVCGEGCVEVTREVGSVSITLSARSVEGSDTNEDNNKICEDRREEKNPHDIAGSIVYLQ